MTATAALLDFAWIGLGANLPFGDGSPVETLQAVIPELASLSDEELLLSSFYESDPKDCPPGSPRYVNAVVGLQPRADETPESLLQKLQALEQEFGRTRSGVTNEARTLDLDLLAFGRETRAGEHLVLPHPRAHERRFVLEPWIEIAGKDLPLEGTLLSHWLAGNDDPALKKLD